MSAACPYALRAQFSGNIEGGEWSFGVVDGTGSPS